MYNSIGQQFTAFNSNLSATVLRALSMANEVDAVSCYGYVLDQHVETGAFYCISTVVQANQYSSSAH